jgi:SAM-dependent methyltransferase
MKLELDKVSRNEVIDSYEQHYQQQGMLRELDAFYRWILKKMQARPQTTLLDVASGEGHLLKIARQQGITPVGVDFSRMAVQTAAMHTCQLTIGDGEVLPFADQSFDYVTNIGSLEHFFDPVAGLREMRRVLRRDGRAAIYLPNSFYLVDIIWHVWRTGYSVSHKQLIERFAAKNEWKDFIEAEGFRVRETYKYNLAFPKKWADLVWYFRHPRKILYLMVAPFIPMNLSYSFLYIVEIE